MASVKNKSMPYRTKTHSWTVSLIHRLLLGKITKYLLIIQAVELICQTSSDAAVFEMHHNDFFAKTFHSGVEFYFCGGDRELKQGCKNSYYKVIDALMFGEVFDRIYSYHRQTSAQSVQVFSRCGEGNNRRSSCMMKCLIIILRVSILKATVKRTTKTLRILPPTFNRSRNKSGWCKLRSYWILTGNNYAESRFTWELRHLLQNKFALGR